MEHPLFTPASVVSVILFHCFVLSFMIHWEISDVSGKTLLRRLLNYIVIYIVISYFIVFFSFKKFSYAPIFLLSYFAFRFFLDFWVDRNNNDNFSDKS